MQCVQPRAFWLVCLLTIPFFPARLPAQTSPVEGLRHNTPGVHAFVNVRIVQGPGRVIDDGVVIIRDGTIEAVGAKLDIPQDARVWDYSGMTVYSGLIELHAEPGTGRDKPGAGSDDKTGTLAGATYWNPQVTPERNVLDTFEPGKDGITNLRSLGFTCALVAPRDGIIGGRSALINLGNGNLNDRLIRPDMTQNVSLVRRSGGGRERTYPTSLMGRIALVRQAMLDARWYGAAQEAYAQNPAQTRPESNDALAALDNDLHVGRPLVFAVNDDLTLLRARKIADEFDLGLWILGSGHEYRQIAVLKRDAPPLIIPVDYPEAPDVSSPEAALGVELHTLRHWDTAPANGALLAHAGISFALTTTGLEKPEKTFYTNVRKAIERGMSADVALAALTTVPADMLGMEDVLGTIDVGKTADLVVTDGGLFAKRTKIIDVWIDGARFEVNERPEVDPRGKWDVTLAVDDLGGGKLELEITGDIDKLKGTIRRDSTDVALKSAKIDLRRLVVSFPGNDMGIEGVVRMTGAVGGDALAGKGELPDGRWFDWRAAAVPEPDKDKATGNAPEKATSPPTKPSSYGAFTLAEVPDQPKHILVRNATIWTSGPQGRLTQADMLVSAGRIAQLGGGLKAPPDAVVIDATGKHVTPGLIDCHSHTGVSGGVNEAGQASTAEVRISDVIDPRAIAWYRELAGGLTVANVLHGSANPIGGQNAVVKLRWSGAPDAMLIAGAMPGIKFALGENVKQSNWGDRFTTRYPQTRMGVEQFIRDRFDAALDYKAQWAEYKSHRRKKGIVPPRRDLELEALVEVLEDKRMIHCHSYRQDEILMLVRVADDYGFQVGVFQHVLEGYKVADVIAAHGAGASTFSDWWAYKFEVYDAIPYNGALMYDVGVVTSFNSDSSELARRLNLEAAKAVKYGGVPPEDALKFVTLNPAIQLHIDDRVGSLEAGKDADFVVWSGDPLSTSSYCEQTWIDGRKYFDIETDRKMRKAVAAERAELIQKVLASDEGRAGAGRGGARASTDQSN